MNKLKAARVTVQIAAFIFIVVSFFLLSFPFKFINIKNFFLSSPSLTALAAIAGQYIIAAFLFVLLFVALALLFGRVFCGWMCPFGAVMDFFAFIASPFRKWKESSPSKTLMSKYVLLLIFFVLAVLGFQFVWIFEPVTVFSRFFYLSFFPFLNAYTDKIFQYLIMNHNVGEGLYYAIHDNLFDARQISFGYSLAFFLLFVIPVLAVLYKRRFWCRYICPLGASLGVLSVKPIFPLKLAKCKVHCGRCENMCRANAIRLDGTYVSSECVMCMDCTALQCRQTEDNGSGLPRQDCKFRGAHHSRPLVTSAPYSSHTHPRNDDGASCCHCEEKPCFDEAIQKSVAVNSTLPSKGMTRKQFLFWCGGALAAIYMIGRKVYASSHSTSPSVIRPPGALPETQFKESCVRCGNCMKVCVTNGLQPVMTESGLDGIWTPKMDNLTGYCEYNCNACGQVCPTHAIEPLPIEKKMEFKIGEAEVMRDICVPWKDGMGCIVCQEHCPIPDKAIKLETRVIKGNTVSVPIVDAELCIGCGICENKCPVEGRKRGIQVKPMLW